MAPSLDRQMFTMEVELSSGRGTENRMAPSQNKVEMVEFAAGGGSLHYASAADCARGFFAHWMSEHAAA